VSYSAENLTVILIFYILAIVESLLPCLILKWLQAGYQNGSQNEVTNELQVS
jgi:hypothetical protein